MLNDMRQASQFIITKPLVPLGSGAYGRVNFADLPVVLARVDSAAARIEFAIAIIVLLEHSSYAADSLREFHSARLQAAIVFQRVHHVVAELLRLQSAVPCILKRIGEGGRAVADL